MFLKKIYVPVAQQNIEGCCRLKSDDNGQSIKVTVQVSTCKDLVLVMNKKVIEKC